MATSREDLIEIQAQQLMLNQLILTIISLAGKENVKWIFAELDSFVQNHSDSLKKKEIVSSDDHNRLAALRMSASVLKQKLDNP